MLVLMRILRLAGLRVTGIRCTEFQLLHNLTKPNILDISDAVSMIEPKNFCVVVEFQVTQLILQAFVIGRKRNAIIFIYY